MRGFPKLLFVWLLQVTSSCFLNVQSILHFFAFILNAFAFTCIIIIIVLYPTCMYCVYSKTIRKCKFPLFLG